MMNVFESIQLRKFLFVLGNLAACAAIAGAIIVPACTFFSDRDDRIADQVKILARLNGIAAQEANVQAIVSDTKAQMQSGEFLAGASENIVSADLQTRIKALTEGAGARPRAVQALPVKTSDQIRYSGSRIEIVGSMQSVHRAVYAIESAKPYLFITGATIKNAPAVSKPGVPEEPVILAQLDIYGAMQIIGRDQ